MIVPIGNIESVDRRDPDPAHSHLRNREIRGTVVAI
jgi:hypothetical protein